MSAAGSTGAAEAVFDMKPAFPDTISIKVT